MSLSSSFGPNLHDASATLSCAFAFAYSTFSTNFLYQKMAKLPSSPQRLLPEHFALTYTFNFNTASSLKDSSRQIIFFKSLHIIENL